MLCRVNKKQLVFVFKIWVLFAPQTPIDFHLTTSTWFLWIATKKKPLGKCQKIFPQQRDFAAQGMKCDKVDCNFCFCQKLFGFSKAQKFGSGVSVGQDRRLTPERPNSLIASKKQLSSHNIHSPSLDAPRRIISLEKALSEELVQLLLQDKEEKCWRRLGGRRWWCGGVERRTVEYRASAERPLRKPRPLRDTVVAAPLEHCTLTTLCTDH